MPKFLSNVLAYIEKFAYKIKNWRSFIRSLVYGTSTPGAGLVNYEGELSVKIVRSGGKEVDFGVVSRRVVTTAGVNYMRDNFNASSGGANIANINYHDSGTGTTAEAIGDTDLVTPAGPITRATGTQSAPGSKQYRSVATITYSGSLAITEHGIFNQAARGAGSILWDRSVFAAINVLSGDSIQFTYTLTINDGG